MQQHDLAMSGSVNYEYESKLFSERIKTSRILAVPLLWSLDVDNIAYFQHEVRRTSVLPF